VKPERGGARNTSLPRLSLYEGGKSSRGPFPSLGMWRRGEADLAIT